MSNVVRFELSPKLIDTILDNSFGMPNDNYKSSEIYVGLGIEFDRENFVFSKEPVATGFTILEEPVEFSEPINGIIRNKNAISWSKATEDWTTGTDQIKYIGLYYRLYDEESDSESESRVQSDVSNEDQEPKYNYELIAVLPLAPAETVLMNEKMVLNANAIQLRLNNR